MNLRLTREDCERPYIDRSGYCDFADAPEHVEGFKIGLGGLMIEFDDERDAVAIARAILVRMGELPTSLGKRPGEGQG